MRAHTKAMTVLLVCIPMAGCTGAIGEVTVRTPAGGAAATPGSGTGGTGGDTDPNAPQDPEVPGLGPVEPLCVSDQRNPWPSHVGLLTNDQIWASLEDVVGMPRTQWRGEVLVGTRPLVFGFENQSALSAITSLPMSAWASFVQDNVAAARMAVQVPCRSMDEGCQRRVIEALGARAFRRTLTEQEITELRRFFTPTLSANFDDALEGVLTGLLLSPNFLYRSQVAQPDGKLTEAQVASWLSYTFLDAPPPRDVMPSQTGTPEARKALVASWIDTDPRFWAKFERFMGGYLGTAKVRSANRDAQRYPGLTVAVRDAMAQEVGGFARWVFEKGSGQFSELMDTSKVFVNRGLADHYKIAWPGGDGFQIVDLAGTAAANVRGGLLTTGAFTASHAHDTETAPVIRGVYVNEHLLCNDLPEVPANLEIMPPVADANLTTRERFRRHSDSPACAGCHSVIDPIGFAFERYDADGTYRDKENGMNVDDSGEVQGLSGSEDDVQSFKGPKELGKLLAKSSVAQACFARQVWRYYVAIPESNLDACDVAKFQEAFDRSGGKLRALLLELAAHPLANVRRAP